MAGPTAPAHKRGTLRRGTASVVARVCLLIPSHALPSFSYRVPKRLAKEVRIGTAVVAPLSGYSRLGIVIALEEAVDGRPLEEIRAVAKGLSLPENMIKLCSWTAGAAALSMGAVLRMALPPGLGISSYKVRRPGLGWPWKAGSVVSRVKLRRFLGGEGLKAAEKAGRIAFAPVLPLPRTVEWVTPVEDAESELLRRAPRQRALLKALADQHQGRPAADLLRTTSAGRDVLRRLVRRGAVRLDKRPEPAPVSYTTGSGVKLAAYEGEVKRALRQGRGSWVWRMSHIESIAAVAAVAGAAIKRGQQVLVLAPEIGYVEWLVEALEGLLPAGLTVAPYHSGLGRGRAAVYEAAREGEVDVLVGTRAAVLVPMERLGALSVMDETNEAHRSDPESYEGIPIHVRDLARARGQIEDATVFFFSPFPSLRVYAPESGTRRLPPREPTRWPAVAVVDMRGTGALLSSTMLDACRRTVRFGGRVGVVVNRLGRATSVSCSRCGFVGTCPKCELPLVLYGRPGISFLFCGYCGHRESVAKECPVCGSERLREAGLTVDKVRAALADALPDTGIGLLTASVREKGEAPVAVGTVRCVLEREWELVVIPDADSLLFSGGAYCAEKGFRLLYGAAEASKERLLVQTRSPDHFALQAALRGDYEAFASAELSKRRTLGYPPHAYLAKITFEGSEEAVRRAIESRLRPAIGQGVELLDPVPLTGDGERPTWRALLRSRKRGLLAEVATLVARLAAETRGGLKARINMDPEEV